MPWIEPHGNGYRVGWRIGGRGSRIEHSDTFAHKATAAAEMRSIAERLAATRKPRSSVLPWAELVNRFIISRERSTTRAHRGQMLRCLAALQLAKGWRSAADVRPAECLALRPYHGRVLRALLNYALLENQVVDARCLVVRPLAKDKRRKPSELLTDQDVSDLIATATIWTRADGALAHCIAIYGLRAESLVGLTCDSLRGDTLRVRVKSGDTMDMPLRPDTGDLLRALLVLPDQEGPRPASAPLFVGRLLRPWRSGQEFSAWWGHCIGGPGRGILDLRRWATTRQMAASGQNARAVADAQGRRTVALVSQIYQRSTEADRSAVFAELPELPPPSSVLPSAPRKTRKSLTGQ